MDDNNQPFRPSEPTDPYGAFGHTANSQETGALVKQTPDDVSGKYDDERGRDRAEWLEGAKARAKEEREAVSPEYDNAYVGFELQPYSSAARRFTEHVTRCVVQREYEAKKAKGCAQIRGPYKRGPKSLAVLSSAVGRFLGPLLIACEPDESGAVARSLDKETFTGQPVGHDTFRAVLDGMKALDLLIHTRGSERFLDKGFDGKPLQLKGTAATFRATPKLLQMAQEAGIPRDDAGAHFAEPQPPIRIKASREWKWLKGNAGRDSAQRYRAGGSDVAVPINADTTRITEQVQSLNSFLQGFSIEGGRFFGFFRGFNECIDRDAFAYDKGGRLYAFGRRAYQTLPQKERARITISGEATTEIDISASYLTAFHGLTGRYLNTARGDLWNVTGVDADALKDWVNVSLTQGRPADRWPEGSQHADVPLELVREKALQAFPALDSLAQAGLNWADLMFAESEAVIHTMLRLKDGRVPSLPVFDSLIVPISSVRLAAGALYDEYYRRVGQPPRLKPKGNITPVIISDIQAALEEDERYSSDRHL